MNYSKLIGQVLGGLVGLAGGLGFNIEWASPEVLAAVATLIGGAIGTYAAPANRPAHKPMARPSGGGF